MLVDFWSILDRCLVDFWLIFSQKNNMNFEHVVCGVLGDFLVQREAKSTKGQCAKIHVECASWPIIYSTSWLSDILGNWRKASKNHPKHRKKRVQNSCYFLEKKWSNSTTKTCSPKCCSKSPFWDPFGVDLGHLGAPRPPQETPPRPPKSDPRATKSG